MIPIGGSAPSGWLSLSLTTHWQAAALDFHCVEPAGGAPSRRSLSCFALSGRSLDARGARRGRATISAARMRPRGLNTQPRRRMRAGILPVMAAMPGPLHSAALPSLRHGLERRKSLVITFEQASQGARETIQVKLSWVSASHRGISNHIFSRASNSGRPEVFFG